MDEAARAGADPKGLVREAYLIEGITLAECRSILIDWALSLPPGLSLADAVGQALRAYGGPEDHPMTRVLREGLAPAPAARRRGGRAGRLG
jgi:hypothetical protein